MSDCNFFNFGVRVTHDTTKHDVVIIDAGSRGIEKEPWMKSRVNTTVMKNFWAHCTQESATNNEIIAIWQTHHTVESCLEETMELWRRWPYLTKSSYYVGDRDRSSYAIWQAMSDKNASERSSAQASSAFKIVAIVGQWTAGDEWSNASALVSYNAAKTTAELSAEELIILDGLYQRMTVGREIEEIKGIVAFWERLHEYRMRSDAFEDQPMTPARAAELVESFKYDELWYELTPAQRRKSGWHSTVNTILNKRAGWAHVAQAIMEYGLPRLRQPEHVDDATEHITALGQFVVDLASWLKRFASRMHAYMQIGMCQIERYNSMVALENRRRRTARVE